MDKSQDLAPIARMASFETTVDAFMVFLHKYWPKNSLVFYGMDVTTKAEGVACFSAVGEEDLMYEIAGRMANKEPAARMFLLQSFCKWMLTTKQTELSAPELQIQRALEEWMDTPTRQIYNQQLHAYRLGDTVSWEQLEMRITDVEADLQRLRNMRRGSDIITRLTAEIKRLKKAGDMRTAAAKQAELERILEDIEKQRVKEQLKAEQRRKNLEQLAEARRSKERKRLARIKAEEDRQRGYKQFQPGKAAKAKMAKIKERQAEKKRKSAGGGETTVRSCSPLLKIQ